MATVERLPSIFATAPNGGLLPWFNPSNVGAQDGSPAVVGHNGPAAQSHQLIATGYGFSVPLGAQILGVTLGVSRSANRGMGGNGVEDSEVRLTMDGSVIGNNKAASGKWPVGASVANYGGSADQWGAALTPEMVNSPNFGVAYAVLLTGVPLPVAAGIDALSLTIEYV